MLKGNNDYHITTYVIGNMQDLYKYRGSLGHGSVQNCVSHVTALFCVLCAVFCVLCAVCCVLCSVFCVLCAVCCVLCAVCCVLCSVCCVLCSVCCVLCSVCCVLCAVYTDTQNRSDLQLATSVCQQSIPCVICGDKILRRWKNKKNYSTTVICGFNKYL